MEEGVLNIMDWDALVERHGSRLLLFARQWTKSTPYAQETVQEGFIKSWRYSRKNRLPSSLEQPAVDFGRIRLEI